MRTLSFVTRYSHVYRGPVTEINVDNTPIAMAIPMQPRTRDNGDVEKERKSISSFTDDIMRELSKEEYGLANHELNAIIDYLTTHGDLFRDFSYENVKNSQKTA